MDKEKHKVMLSVAVLLVILSLWHAIIYPAITGMKFTSIVPTEQPNYEGIYQGALLIMTPSVELSRQGLFRYQTNDMDQVSRLVGFPGDEITFIDRSLYINQSLYRHYEEITLPNSSLLVPEGSVFRFPDHVSQGRKPPGCFTLNCFLTKESEINGTVLSVINAKDIRLVDYIRGIAVALLFIVCFAVLEIHKKLVFRPIRRLYLVSLGVFIFAFVRCQPWRANAKAGRPR